MSEDNREMSDKTLEENMKDTFEHFYRKINHEYTESFSRLMIEAIKSGDFQVCIGLNRDSLIDNKNRINLTHSYGMTYIPYREVSSLKLRLKEMQEKLDAAIEVIKFYGNDEFYQGEGIDGYDISEAEFDNGNRARNFLKARGE